MNERQQARWTLSSGALVLLVIAIPLWNEFRVRGNLAWTIFLAAFLLALGVAVMLLQRYFRQHASEIGEARFDTTGESKES